MIEMRDEVPSLPFNAQNLINEIRNLFSQEYKFNYIQINEEFFKNFENRINFMYDIYRVPVFKNNLVKIKLNKIDSLAFEEWKNINVINPTTWNYLNRIKTKIQREKDEELKKQKEEEIRKKNYIIKFIKKMQKIKTHDSVKKINNKNNRNNLQSEDLYATLGKYGQKSTRNIKSNKLDIINNYKNFIHRKYNSKIQILNNSTIQIKNKLKSNEKKNKINLEKDKEKDNTKF